MQNKTSSAAKKNDLTGLNKLGDKTLITFNVLLYLGLMLGVPFFIQKLLFLSEFPHTIGHYLDMIEDLIFFVFCICGIFIIHSILAERKK